MPYEHLDKFIEIFNALSDYFVSLETIIKEVNKIPQFEMKRLCQLVKIDMHKRNPFHTTTDEKEFLQQNASISYNIILVSNNRFFLIENTNIILYYYIIRYNIIRQVTA